MGPHVVVIGGGVAGSAAAEALVRRGARVTLLEQFAFGHERGSSHGASRITRTTYEEPFWVRLMSTAHREDWPALEARAGDVLISRGDLVTFGGPGSTFSAHVDAVRGVPEVALLDKDEAARRFPDLLLGDAMAALWDRSGGVVRAAATLSALRRLAEAGGATLRSGVTVEAIEGVRVVTDSGVIDADRIVVCAGPFTAKLLPGLSSRLIVRPQAVGYATLEGGREDALPAWIHLGSNGRPSAYGLANGDGLAKAAWHRLAGPHVDPGAVGDIDDEEADAVRELFRLRLRRKADVTRIERCLYTVTSGEVFVLDTLPAEPRIAVVAGLSGHGFKFAPLLGRIVAGLVLDGDSGVEAFEGERGRFAVAR